MPKKQIDMPNKKQEKYEIKYPSKDQVKEATRSVAKKYEKALKSLEKF